MVESNTSYKVIGICGSLRKDSTNLSALKLISTLEKRIELEIINYVDVPLYNGDVESASGVPDSVKALAAKIAAADGVYIASPEYNYSITGVLKNLIDWLSRVQPHPFNQKPIAIFSATGGPSGGARSQYELRKIFVYFNANVLNKEAMIGSNYLKFNQAGEITDDAAKSSLAAQAAAFADYIAFVKKGLSDRA